MAICTIVLGAMPLSALQLNDFPLCALSAAGRSKVLAEQPLTSFDGFSVVIIVTLSTLYQVNVGSGFPLHCLHTIVLISPKLINSGGCGYPVMLISPGGTEV